LSRDGADRAWAARLWAFWKGKPCWNSAVASGEVGAQSRNSTAVSSQPRWRSASTNAVLRSAAASGDVSSASNANASAAARRRDNVGRGADAGARPACWG
jgi:hypothetical protein